MSILRAPRPSASSGSAASTASTASTAEQDTKRLSHACGPTLDDVAPTSNIGSPPFPRLDDQNPNHPSPSPSAIRASCGSVGRSTYSPIPRPSLLGGRVRSRTTISTYTPPLAPVMSRENSIEEISMLAPAAADPSSLPSSSSSSSGILGRVGRRASKSVSLAGPSASANAPAAGLKSAATRIGLKRRISTPTLVTESAHTGLSELVSSSDTIPEATAISTSTGADKKKKDRTVTRGRSTSTSYVVPHSVDQDEKPVAGPSRLTLPPGAAPVRDDTGYPYGETYQPIPIYVAKPSLEQTFKRSRASPLYALEAAYNAGESSLLHLARWVRPLRRHNSQRQNSDGDSEKGLDFSEEDSSTSADSASLTRTSEESVRRGGRYWMGGSEDDNAGYFSLPATPPTEPESDGGSGFAEFSLGLAPNSPYLPTPALSAKSLSRAGSKAKRNSRRDLSTGPANGGWLSHVITRVWTKRERTRSEGKFSPVIRNLGWTLALLGGLFLATAAVAAWSISSMPITQLKQWPRSTTDLQLLSAEIRKYMASSTVGYYHTVGVLVFIGCWKHAWSVPGAVVLNILVGSILDTFSAVTLLTFITATGSLFCYLLSRPLAPLITVLFPKPLSLVRAALAPEQVPTAPHAAIEMDEKVTAIQLSSNPASPAIGGESSASVWRRLLIMRAAGFVPWSGMNVACGVVEVDWKVFWLTTAAGSASWSYVTASVGNILSRLAIPEGATSAATAGDTIAGESLTSLLRDPYLIAKLVLLSAASLIPVLFKKRNVQRGGEQGNGGGGASATLDGPPSPLSPSSALSRSLARFTPTPHVFDLLSFGRTLARQGSNIVLGSVRGASAAVQRVTPTVSSSSSSQ